MHILLLLCYCLFVIVVYAFIDECVIMDIVCRFNKMSADDILNLVVTYDTVIFFNILFQFIFGDHI